MIQYQQFILSNGLQVYVHEDHNTTMAAFNICYNVGSRDEEESKTGFAHLFEHLMFGGSKNIPSYDTPLQKVGGENNAFTSPDITNYYINLPAVNIETAFWLESDRMLELSFDPQVLEVQRKVVIEEFKQRYLNQPYGDAWLKIRPLSYQVHPYKWATIGKDISHIENATMDEVKSFFYKYYIPNNAVLVVAGNITFEPIKGWQTNLMLANRTSMNHDEGYYTSKFYAQKMDNHTGYAYQSMGDSRTQNLELTSKYNTQINKSRIEALDGYSYQYNVNEVFNANNILKNE